jgi:hypothetical protein
MYAYYYQMVLCCGIAGSSSYVLCIAFLDVFSVLHTIPYFICPFITSNSHNQFIK